MKLPFKIELAPIVIAPSAIQKTFAARTPSNIILEPTAAVSAPSNFNIK